MAEAEVTTAGAGTMAHHLVRYETAQVSVDNTGMIHLSLTRPQDVDELIEALKKAKEVGIAQQQVGEQAQEQQEEQAREAIRLQNEARANERRTATNARASTPRAGARRVKSERVNPLSEQEEAVSRAAAQAQATGRLARQRADRRDPVERAARNAKQAPKKASQNAAKASQNAAKPAKKAPAKKAPAKKAPAKKATKK